MKKLRNFQKVITLAEGDTIGEVDFPTVPGAIIGYSTQKVGSVPTGEFCNITWKDGGQNIADPTSIEVGEITNKNSISGQIVPMPVAHPGSIKAVATPSSQIGTGEDYKVLAILWYVEGERNAILPSSCF